MVGKKGITFLLGEDRPAKKKIIVEFLKMFIFSRAFQLAVACVFLLQLSSVLAVAYPEFALKENARFT